MIQRFLKITAIGGVKEAVNKRPYMVIKFEGKSLLEDGTPIYNTLPQGTRTVFGPYKDEKGNEFKADGLFIEIIEGRAKVGGLIEGQIVRVLAKPYHIEGSEFEAKTWTGVVFRHENVQEYVNKQLKPSFSCMIDEHGVLTAPEQCEKPVGVSGREVEV